MPRLADFTAVFDKREVQVVPDAGRHGGTEDSVRLFRAGPLWDPAEADGDAVHVGVDGEGGPSHGEDEHAGGRLRADAGQRNKVFLDRLVVEVMQAAEVDPALALTDRGQDLLDPARLLVRDAAAADGVGHLFRWRLQDLAPVRELGFELGERASGVKVGGVLGQHRRDQFVDDRQPRLGHERALAGTQQALDSGDIRWIWHRTGFLG